MEEKLIINYIAAWNWEIISLIFFCFSLLFFAIERTTITSVFYISFFIIFIGTQIIALLRQRGVANE